MDNALQAALKKSSLLDTETEFETRDIIKSLGMASGVVGDQDESALESTDADSSADHAASSDSDVDASAGKPAEDGAETPPETVAKSEAKSEDKAEPPKAVAPTPPAAKQAKRKLPPKFKMTFAKPDRPRGKVDPLDVVDVNFRRKLNELLAGKHPKEIERNPPTCILSDWNYDSCVYDTLTLGFAPQEKDERGFDVVLLDATGKFAVTYAAFFVSDRGVKRGFGVKGFHVRLGIEKREFKAPQHGYNLSPEEYNLLVSHLVRDLGGAVERIRAWNERKKQEKQQRQQVVAAK